MITLLVITGEMAKLEFWWHAQDREELGRLIHQSLEDHAGMPPEPRDRDYFLAASREILPAVAAWSEWTPGTHWIPGLHRRFLLLIS